MTTNVIKENGFEIALISSDEIVINDVQSALDFLMSARYTTGCDRIALNKEAICEDFFKLSTCLAGEVLQKFINYQAKFAIYGDFSQYTSKPLHDFIYESNNGTDIFFVSTAEEAVGKLAEQK